MLGFEMSERTRRVNVQWTFKRMNRKAGGLAQSSKRSRPNDGIVFAVAQGKDKVLPESYFKKINNNQAIQSIHGLSTIVVINVSDINP